MFHCTQREQHIFAPRHWRTLGFQQSACVTDDQQLTGVWVWVCVSAGVISGGCEFEWVFAGVFPLLQGAQFGFKNMACLALYGFTVCLL